MGNVMFLFIWLTAWLAVNDEDWSDGDYVRF
jgi:hypothetical protein